MADATKAAAARRSFNPWVLHLQKLGLELKCPLCLGLLSRPFLLPCDHIFCNPCLPESTEFGCECPICKAQYNVKDLRSLPLIENMVSIYKSLDAAFCANLSPSTPFVCDNNSSRRQSTISQVGDKLGHHPSSFVENSVEKDAMANDCTLPRANKDKEYDMVVRRDGCNSGKNANSPPVSSPMEAGGLQYRGCMQIGINQVDQFSPGSPPSFGDIRGSENDSNDQAGDDSPQNYQAVKLVKRNTHDRTKQGRHDGSASETEEGRIHVSKRHKMLNYARLRVCTDVGTTKPISSREIESVMVHADTQTPEKMDGLSAVDTICGFCQTSKISEDTGPMLHYVNGKPVVGNEAACLPNAIHVHKVCIEWAPQVYFVGETVKNLKAELARGAKLKCSKCGLKGAALGCYLQSCRRSYHVTCAMEVTNCRWDYDDFLLLCPSHSSIKFPSEKSKSSKHSSKRCPVPSEIVPQQSGFWEGSSNGAKEWVFCGSALSSEEKCLLVKFGSMIGVPVTKFWRPDVTHVIAATDSKGACTRTLKVLMAILNGKWVLTVDWMKTCREVMRPVDEEPYEVELDNHGSQGGPKTGRLRVLDNAPKLFHGMEFYFYGDFLSGYKEDLQNLVTNAGGIILRTEEAVLELNSDQVAHNCLVVYNLDPPKGCMLGEEVTIIWERLNEAQGLAAKIGCQVVGHTWLLESIAAYKLQPIVSS